MSFSVRSTGVVYLDCQMLASTSYNDVVSLRGCVTYVVMGFINRGPCRIFLLQGNLFLVLYAMGAAAGIGL